MKDLTYDFSCWVMKYDGRSIYGRVYQKNSLEDIGCVVVPLLWSHQQTILGTAILEHRDGEGVYAYCTLNDLSSKEAVINLIKDRGSVSISPFTTNIKYNGNVIVSGIIREVSLVPVRVDPDEDYYPVLKGD